MNKNRRALHASFAIAATIIALGCNSSNEQNGPTAREEIVSTNITINVSGGYVGQRSNANGSATIAVDFNQSDGKLTGSLTDSSLGTGVVNGSMSSNRLEFVTLHNNGDLIVEWTGAANPAATELQGSWVIIVGGNASGEWIVAR